MLLYFTISAVLTFLFVFGWVRYLEPLGAVLDEAVFPIGILLTCAIFLLWPLIAPLTLAVFLGVVFRKRT